MGSEQGLLYVISAPSGTGKSSLLAALLQKDAKLRRSISTTTRAPRPQERHGVEYFFVDPQTFEQRQEQGAFLESAHVHGFWYGTSVDSVDDMLSQGLDVLLEIDVQGAQTIQGKRACVSIMILPPSFGELEQRLRQRATETEQAIALRLSNAKQEMRHYPQYDYLIINDDFDKALTELHSIIRTYRCQKDRMLSAHAERLEQLISN